MTRTQLAEKVRRRVEETGASVLPYDVRMHADRGRRRSLKLWARRVLRLGTLYGLDGACVVATCVALYSFVDTTSAPDLSLLAVAVLGLTWLGLTLAGTYRAGQSRRDPARLAVGLFLGLGLLWLFVRMAPQVQSLRWWLPVYSLLLYAVLVLERGTVERIVISLRRRGHLLRRTLVLGTADDAWQFMREVRSDPGSDLMFVGHLTPDPGTDPTAKGGFDVLDLVIEEEDVELVVLPSGDKEPRMEEIIEMTLAAGVPLVALRSAARRLAGKIEIAENFGPTALSIHPPALRLPELTLKRAFDLVAATAALVVLAPVFAVVAVLIKLDSAGPVFFRQTRVGVGGRLFRMFKFRSMYVDAEDRKEELQHLNAYGDPRLFKIEDDPRITRRGAFLRRTSLDELPQLLNVLLGDMSLVGPRPPLPEEVVSYELRHFDRLAVLPGVTGPWQVNGRNNIRDFEAVVAMERDYIRNWSLLLDLKILARTFGVVFRGDGAH